VRTIRRLAHAAAIAGRDKRIPRPLRGAVAIGLLPLPGPFDEAVLALVAIPLLVFYREPMRDAWRSAAARDSSPARGSSPARS
jgi:hypothetical protein